MGKTPGQANQRQHEHRHTDRLVIGQQCQLSQLTTLLRGALGQLAQHVLHYDEPGNDPVQVLRRGCVARRITQRPATPR